VVISGIAPRLPNSSAYTSTSRGRASVALSSAIPEKVPYQKLRGKVLGTLQRLDDERLGCGGKRITRVEYVVEAV